MLGEVVSLIIAAFRPIEIELCLCNAVLEPMISHIKSL